MTGVHTFEALGTEDRFVTSSVPVAGSPEAGKRPRFVMSGLGPVGLSVGFHF